MDFYYQDQLRWSFGFDNPNKAAALIASLLPLLWLAISAAWSIKRPWLHWLLTGIATLVLAIGWWGLFNTFSRGGIAAAIAAFAYIGCRTRSQWIRGWPALVAALAVLVALFIATRAAERSIPSAADKSVAHRLTVWKGGLEMLASIPQGVGTGNSGEVYMQWFEPPEMDAGYRTLVNSYLTFAVEQGLGLFGAALFAAIFIWRWAPCQTPNRLLQNAVTAARASLIGFAVAGFFTTTMEEPMLWVPAGAAVAFLFGAKLASPWRPLPHPPANAALHAVAVTGVVCAILFLSGLLFDANEPVRISAALSGVTVVPREAKPGAISVLVDEQVSGKDYGKMLRQLAVESKRALHVGPMADSASDPWMLVMGSRIDDMKDGAGKRLILIAPARLEDPASRAILGAASRAILFLPGFDEDGRVSAWRKAATGLGAKVEVHDLDSVGTEVAWDWPDITGQLTKTL